MFFDDPKFGRIRFHDEVVRLATEVSEEFWFSIRYKRSLIDTAYACAKGTVSFHGIEANQTNHFKELAHLAYWLCRMKPLRIEPPQNIQSIIEEMAQGAQEAIFGEQAFPEREYNTAVENFLRNLLFPINEYCAVMLCYDFIKLGWGAQFDVIEDPKYRDIVKDRMDFLGVRFENKVADELIWSLMYHNFSARGFAVMLEGVLDVRLGNE